MHYILSREKIEHYALRILKQYKPDCLHIPQAIDVYDFMEHFLQLEIDFKNLSQDQSVLGLTSFNDGIYLVWSDDRTTEYPIEVRDGTVILENFLLDSNHNGRERFTVMHECSHQILHRDCFLKAAETTDAGLFTCAKRDIESRKGKRLVTSRDWIEWQANTLAAAMLMPKYMVKEAFFDMLDRNPKLCPLPLPLTLQLDVLIFDIANVFNVSYQAMKIRLLQLGLVKDRAYEFDREAFKIM